MKIKKLYAVALAATMTIGAMVPAMPVLADSQTTTITLGVATKNQYTMIIPSSTELNHDGSAKAMTNGLTIKCEHQTKDVVVTLTSYYDWHLKADDISTKIGYSVYTDESATTECKTVEFTKAEIMKRNDAQAIIGTTKDIYVKPVAEDLDAAEGGNYSDTITFTATLKADIPTVTVAGVSIKAAEGQTWAEIARNNENVDFDGRNRVIIDHKFLYSDAGDNVTADETFSASGRYMFFD